MLWVREWAKEPVANGERQRFRRPIAFREG